MNVQLKRRAILIASMLIAGGCQESAAPNPTAGAPQPAKTVHPLQTGLSSSQWREDLEAWVDPPIGWRPDEIKANSRHVHQTWISPSGNTAYGVIVMKLPWPVGPDLTLMGFLQHMHESEGKADVSEKLKDASLPGYRFVAAGNMYEIHVNLIVHDWRAWAIYAGTIISEPIVKDELELAGKARDITRVGPG